MTVAQLSLILWFSTAFVQCINRPSPYYGRTTAISVLLPPKIEQETESPEERTTEATNAHVFRHKLCDMLSNEASSSQGKEKERILPGPLPLPPLSPLSNTQRNSCSLSPPRPHVEIMLLRVAHPLYSLPSCLSDAQPLPLLLSTQSNRVLVKKRGRHIRV